MNLKNLIISEEVFEYFERFCWVETLNQANNNPTELTNPYWQWVVKHNLSPDDIGDIFNIDVYQSKSLWGFGRMGQSQTVLPDGRMVLIGGEYEDYYDPQFAIYNDVVVIDPMGNIKIYAYPKDIFPPTDFHSAVLIDDAIWIIGGLGYMQDRQYHKTLIYRLNIHTFEITKVNTINDIGLIHDHIADVDNHQILVKEGEMLTNTHPLIDGEFGYKNINAWAFDTKNLIWKNITNYQWQCFFIKPKNTQKFYFWEYSQLIWNMEYYQDKKEYDEEINVWVNELSGYLGDYPNIQAYRDLYRLPMEFQLQENEEYRTTIIWIDGIKVRCIENDYFEVYIEGWLADDKLMILKNHFYQTLALMANSPCEIGDLPN